MLFITHEYLRWRDSEKTRAIVSNRKNSIVLNPHYSRICIRTKLFHSDVIRSRTKDPNGSDVKLRIPIRFNSKSKQGCQSDESKVKPIFLYDWIRLNPILKQGCLTNFKIRILIVTDCMVISDWCLIHSDGGSGLERIEGRSEWFWIKTDLGHGLKWILR